MTLQEMIQEIPSLSIVERKALIAALVDSLTEVEKNSIIERTPGLHSGTTWVRDDFDEPLPDSFWLGEE